MLGTIHSQVIHTQRFLHKFAEVWRPIRVVFIKVPTRNAHPVETDRPLLLHAMNDLHEGMHQGKLRAFIQFRDFSPDVITEERNGLRNFMPFFCQRKNGNAPVCFALLPNQQPFVLQRADGIADRCLRQIEFICQPAHRSSVWGMKEQEHHKLKLGRAQTMFLVFIPQHDPEHFGYTFQSYDNFAVNITMLDAGIEY